MSEQSVEMVSGTKDRPPAAAIRAIADTSRYDAPTEARDLDAECALAAMAILPLKDRAEIAVWLLSGWEDRPWR